MFKKILIANRGEIAVRIIRCCKEMGIEAVAVYSSADATSLHVQLADEAYCIGPAKSSESYLNMENILSVATLSGCDAIHPGFGYLSENSTFARLVEKCGMTFIGPSGDVIDQMGNKSVARQMMIEAGVPVVPGSDGSIESVSQGKEIARKIGYPVLIKASAGGGGRGMRKCFKEEDFENAYLTAKAEAKACFGDDDMYMEKLILNPKHIEFKDNWGMKDETIVDSFDFKNIETYIGMIVINSKEDIEPMVNALSPYFNIQRHQSEFSFDLTLRGESKAKGILELVKHLNRSIQDTVAFGDGRNDIEMLSEVGLGIAMGNAAIEAKHVADFITDDVDKDGIVKALHHFSLLKPR